MLSFCFCIPRFCGHLDILTQQIGHMYAVATWRALARSAYEEHARLTSVVVGIQASSYFFGERRDQFFKRGLIPSWYRLVQVCCAGHQHLIKHCTHAWRRKLTATRGGISLIPSACSVSAICRGRGGSMATFLVGVPPLVPLSEAGSRSHCWRKNAY